MSFCASYVCICCRQQGWEETTTLGDKVYSVTQEGMDSTDLGSGFPDSRAPCIPWHVGNDTLLHRKGVLHVYGR